MGKLYIAYGSNLNLHQMAFRCPSASIYAKGILMNWELLFRGTKGNAHATIKRKKGASVPVLVWEIQPEDEDRLDLYEGIIIRKISWLKSEEKRKKPWYISWTKAALPGRPLHNMSI